MNCHVVGIERAYAVGGPHEITERFALQSGDDVRIQIEPLALRDIIRFVKTSYRMSATYA